MKFISPLLLAAAFSFSLVSCKNDDDKKSKEEKTMKEPNIKEEAVTYKLDSATMNNFVAYDENQEGKRPAVMVIHEWWGINDYIKMRVRELAKLGYIAMAVDMYGDNKVGNDPNEAQALATPFYMHPEKAKPIFDAAIEKIKSYPQTDATKIAAIGYCFGGTQVLNLAKMGEDLKGVVSFHGGLEGLTPDKNKVKAAILVCHGADDSFVPPAQVDNFKKQMDSAGISYEFKSYPGSTHAFTNPMATEWGKKFNIPIAYNAAADTASWKDMRDFFDRIFK
jgi:dienelactone hydrolase